MSRGKEGRQDVESEADRVEPCRGRATQRLHPEMPAPRWYHGGIPGLKRGQQILPPSVTGAVSVADKMVTAPAAEREQIAKVHDPDLVYLSQDIADARLWASLAPAYGGKRRGGDVYEVVPDGPLVPDPDYLPQDGKVMACCSATVLRAVERRVPRPTPQEIAILGGAW